MESNDLIINQRLAGLRAKLTTNTKLALIRSTRLLLKAGFNLPSNGDDVSRFLLEKADQNLKINTLRNYCSMIIKWHRMAEYEDAANDIERLAFPVLAGLKLERIEQGLPESRKTATPLQLDEALRIDKYLSNQISELNGSNLSLAIQDLCLFRLLWWSGARESEIATLQRWQITFNDNPRGILISWSKTKTDRKGTGTTRLIPALPEADPYGAMIDWIELHWPFAQTDHKDSKPLFIRQLRNGDWRDSHIHPNSIPLWLRKIAKAAGVRNWACLSGHSFRHGLATMMADKLSIREVMDYFKWKRADTAYGYATNKGVSENVLLRLSTASKLKPSVLIPDETKSS